MATNMETDPPLLEPTGNMGSQDAAISTTSVKPDDANPFGNNPVGMLNEYAQKTGSILKWVEYGISKSHPIEFAIAAVIGDKQFNPAQASNKKLGRKLAAVEALKMIEESGVSVIDIASNKALKRKANHDGSQLGPSQSYETIQQPQPKKKKLAIQQRNPDEYEVVPESAVQTMIQRTARTGTCLIMEYAAKRQVAKPVFQLVYNAQFLDFTCRCVFMDQLADNCYGKSKAQAKEAAAITILNKLIHTSELKYLEKSALPSTRVLSTPKQCDATPHNVYELAATAVNTHVYLEAQKNPLIANSAKVIAGIVITDDRTGNAWVASWGTGTRTLSGDLLRMDGTTVNDSHAEVLSRRGFIRFIYRQLNDYLQNKDTIFDPVKGADNRLKLRPNLHVHLYINTAPCGDGRVFTLVEGGKKCGRTSKRNYTNPKANLSDDPNIMIVHSPFIGDPQKHGLLRSKIEQGEGTVPTIDLHGEQTIDGINGGERLRTMSCSDKILKWNIVGLQGTLLSLFLQPIYLKSIVIGALCNHAHIARAICCRAAKTTLPRGFKVNHPIIVQTNHGESAGRDTSKTSNLCANWNRCDDSVELINGFSGQTDVPPTFLSRLSKKSIFAEYKSLCRALEQADWIQPTYGETKAKVIPYNMAKLEMLKYLKANQFGSWMAKPREEKLFS